MVNINDLPLEELPLYSDEVCVKEAQELSIASARVLDMLRRMRGDLAVARELLLEAEDVIPPIIVIAEAYVSIMGDRSGSDGEAILRAHTFLAKLREPR